MGCPHVGRCPLFPLLNASLRSWREYYCDTGDDWRDCARYRLSRTGAVVPIALLPNGATAQHLRAAASGVERAEPARPTVTGRPWFDPRQPPDSPAASFEQAAAPARPSAHPLFPPVEQPARSTPEVPPRPRRRWWTRLTDWISGPA